MHFPCIRSKGRGREGGRTRRRGDTFEKALFPLYLALLLECVSVKNLEIIVLSRDCRLFIWNAYLTQR